MTRETLAERLLGVPVALHAAEAALLEAAAAAALARVSLELAESELLLRGIEGRNEAERKARLFQATLPAQEELRDRTQARDAAALQVRCLTVEASCLRSVARLIGDSNAD